MSSTYTSLSHQTNLQNITLKIKLEILEKHNSSKCREFVTVTCLLPSGASTIYLFLYDSGNMEEVAERF